MLDVINKAGKLTCRVDPVCRSVEISQKGILTCIYFLSEGRIAISGGGIRNMSMLPRDLERLVILVEADAVVPVK